MGYIDKHRKQKKKTNYNQFTFDGNGYETTDIEETIFETANGHEHGEEETENDYFEPFTLKIDADGDQTEELSLAFSSVDDTKVKVTVTYIHPQGGKSPKPQVFEFSPQGGSKNFDIVHQEVTDGVYTYKLFLNEPDYEDVFYATDIQRAKSASAKNKMRQDYINSFDIQDKIIPEDMIESHLALNKALNPIRYLGINFSKNSDGVAEYSLTHYRGKDQPDLGNFTVKNHQYATVDTPIVRDLTDVREKDEAATDRKASSFTVPIEVGLGENNHKYEITFSEHQSNESNTGGAFGRAMEENGLAYIALDGWLGVRKIPIPLPFKDLEYPEITHHATHMEVCFKGKLYDTILRIYQRHQVIPASEKGKDAEPDEVFAVVVRVDPLPSNKEQIPEKSHAHFGKTIPYKTQFIDGDRKPYKSDYNYYTDENEFEQNATEDARANLSRQSTSSSKDDELFNITLEETKAFGAILKEKTFTDIFGMKVKGEELFYRYLSLVISIKKLAGIMRSKKQRPEDLLHIQNAIEQARLFIILADTLADSPLGPRIKTINSNFNGNVLDTSKLRHQKPNTLSVKPKYDIRQLPEMIRNAQWDNVNGAMDAQDGLHAIMQRFVIKQKSADIIAHFEQLAKKDISEYLDEEKKKNRYNEKLAKTERLQVEQIKELHGSFNLDTRYRLLIEQEKPPENKIQRVKALFYPEHLNVGQDIQEATAIDLPLYYYQKDGKWVVVSMANKQKNTFFFSGVSTAVKAGETHPPYEVFEGLDHVDHLPKGLLFYEISGGESRKLYMTSRTPWWKYAGYVALALFAIGLTVATLGGGAAAAAVATKVLFTAAGVVGATGAAMTMYDESQTGQLTTKSVIVNTLDILGAFVGVTKLATAAKVTKAVNTAQKAELAGGLMGKLGMKALTGRHAYIALEVADLGVDTMMVLIGTGDGIAQLYNILTGPGTWSERMADAAKIVPFLIMQGALFFGTVPGRKNDINDALKNKMIGALPKQSKSAIRKGESPITKDATPFLAGLKQRKVFKDGVLEAMAAKLDNLEGLEKALSLIGPNDLPRIKALSARFSDENVLYALYYFRGNLDEVAKHLKAHPKVFGDRGLEIEEAVYAYEMLKNTSKKTTSREMTSEVEFWKAKYEESKLNINTVKERARNNQNAWEKYDEQLTKLKEAQTKTVDNLKLVKEKVSSAQDTLVGYQYEAHLFEEFAQLKKLDNIKNYDEWMQMNSKRFDKNKADYDELFKRIKKKETDLTNYKETFQKNIGAKVEEFYSQIEVKRKHLQEVLRGDPENVVAQNGLKKIEEEISTFHQQQEDLLLDYLKSVEKKEAWIMKRKEQLDFRKRAVDGNEQTKVKIKTHFEKQAALLKKQATLRNDLSNLKTTRDQLVTKVQQLESDIMKLRLEMADHWKSTTLIQEKIKSLSIEKSNAQKDLVAKEDEIANIEQELGKLDAEVISYDLTIKDTIDPKEMTPSNYKVLLEQKTVSRDVNQMGKLTKAQQEQVNSVTNNLTKTTTQHQDALVKLKQLNANKRALFKKQDEITKALNGGEPIVQSGKTLKKSDLKKMLDEVRDEINRMATDVPNARRTARDLYEQKQRLKRQLVEEQSKQALYEEFYALQTKVKQQQDVLEGHKQAYHSTLGDMAIIEKKIKANTDITEQLYIKQQDDYAKLLEQYTLERNGYARKVEEADRLKVDYGILRENASKARQLASLERQKEEIKRGMIAHIKSAYRAMVETHWKFFTDDKTLRGPILKAFWKIHKILLKIIRPKTGAMDNIGAEVTEEGKELEALLENYMSSNDKKIGVLPDGNEELWEELSKTLEDPQLRSYYPAKLRGELMTLFVDMQQQMDKLSWLNTEILQERYELSNLPKTILMEKFKLKESDMFLSKRDVEKIRKYIEKLNIPKPKVEDK